MSALPSLQDELNRKAFQSMEWLTNAFDKGKVSEAQFSTGVDVLFMATSGLVDGEILTLVTQASTLARQVPEQVRRHFIMDGTIISLTWRVDDAMVTIVKRQNGLRNEQVLETATPAQARDRVQTLAQRLLARGFEEV